MAEVTLGLDLGTSGVGVVALDRSGQLVAGASRSYPLLTPRPGWTEQRPQDWAAAALEALGEVASQLREAGQGALVTRVLMKRGYGSTVEESREVYKELKALVRADGGRG